MARPRFLKSLLDSWQLSLAQNQASNLIPFWIAGSIGFASAIVLNLPEAFWKEANRGTLVSIISGLLTFNGIVLALCWSAFGKVYEIIGASAFCAHLRKHNLLSHYLVFVTYCQAVQVVAISCTAAALFVLWLPLPLWVSKVVLVASLGATAYAVRQGVATSTVMQDLIWAKSEFESGQTRPPVQAATN
jgi:hypothetical protein